MFELYDKVIYWEYVRNKDIYEQINAEFIPYEENRQLQQITDAIIQQCLEDLENVTKSLGFYLDYNGRKILTPLSQVYTNYLDNACFGVVTGAFDYGSVLRRVVTQLTNSGLRKIEYGSGYASRVEVAARRAATNHFGVSISSFIKYTIRIVTAIPASIPQKSVTIKPSIPIWTVFPVYKFH